MRRGRTAADAPPVHIGPNPHIGPNEVLRFLLELAALAFLGWWGATVLESTIGSVALAIALPLVAATAWGLFRVPNDPKPNPPVEVPGPVRLLIELAVFGSGLAAALSLSMDLAYFFGMLLLVHHAAGYRRTLRLLRNQPLA